MWCRVACRYRNAGRGRKRQQAGTGQNPAQVMLSIISSPSQQQLRTLLHVIFGKLTFNRDFRSTKFQEIKINSCPALAASWGQCLLSGALGTGEILGWQSSSSLAALCPPTTHPVSSLDPLLLFLHMNKCLFTKLLQLHIASGVVTNNQPYLLWSHRRVNSLCGVPGKPSVPHTAPCSMSFSMQWHKSILLSSRRSWLGCWNKEDYNRNVSPSRPCCNSDIRNCLPCSQCLNHHNERRNVVKFPKRSGLCSQPDFLEKTLISQALFQCWPLV